LVGYAAALALSSPAAAKSSASTTSEVAALEYPAAVFVTGKDGARGHGSASGLADPRTGRKLTVDTPVRIASNTKTFTAATVLRLWEQRRIDLDGPIGPLLTPALNELLRADGYDTQRITVRHLLSHSAGLYDHGGDPRFTQALFAHPDHAWTREELVRLSINYADPQAEPGTEFRYSDTGYILLGDVIERVTKKSLAGAVREQLHLDRLGLKSTWWEVMEPMPLRATPRARQWLGGKEATNIHASMDLYGGGGLVMSARKHYRRCCGKAHTRAATSIA
jgi:D-alanyl-D-alanine carboxypeptidase